MSGTRWSKTCQQQEPTVSAPGANYYDGCQTSNVRRRNMSRSRESRPRGSRKQQTKITYAARAKSLSRFKKNIMGHRDSLSQLILSLRCLRLLWLKKKCSIVQVVFLCYESPCEQQLHQKHSQQHNIDCEKYVLFLLVK